MNARKNTFIHIAISVVFLLLCIESLAYFINLSKDSGKPFLIDLRAISNNSKAQPHNIVFDEIDQLLGWKMSNSEIEKRGYIIKHNFIFLYGSTPCSKPVKILITGGSTSDVVLDNNNWPNHLHTLLNKKKICHEIYVAAVGGYSSGQELLKLIRDAKSFTPDIHISYSGANECFNSSYENFYLHDILKKMLADKSLLFPNTIFLLRNTILKNLKKPHLKEQMTFSPDEFWYDNMAVMNASALCRQYRFVAVLQPVKGVGNHRDGDENDYNAHIDCYKGFYKKVGEKMYNDSIIEYYNLSLLFDNFQEKVFIDDCHLLNKFQPEVAKAVFEIIFKNEE